LHLLLIALGLITNINCSICLLELSLSDQLEPEKLKGQNGMLAYRFVINCEGKAGRFIFRSYDFDYPAKEFSSTAKAHLLEILLRLKTWQPCVIRSENRDSYAYITFKIKDGEIIDILP